MAAKRDTIADVSRRAREWLRCLRAWRDSPFEELDRPFVFERSASLSKRELKFKAMKAVAETESKHRPTSALTENCFHIVASSCAWVPSGPQPLLFVSVSDLAVATTRRTVVMHCWAQA